MAKLIFEYAEILDNTGASLTPEQFIKNITVDAIEITNEENVVEVEDAREVFESYKGKIVIRSTDTVFTQVGGTGAETDILGSQYISTDGTTPTEARLRLHGKSGSHDITTANTYLQGKRMFDNGRLETMVMGSAEDVDSTTSIAVSTPA